MIIDADAHVEESQEMLDRQGKIEIGVINIGCSKFDSEANQICYTRSFTNHAGCGSHP
jgi:hypothetical protein